MMWSVNIVTALRLPVALDREGQVDLKLSGSNKSDGCRGLLDGLSFIHFDPIQFHSHGL